MSKEKIIDQFNGLCGQFNLPAVSQLSPDEGSAFLDEIKLRLSGAIFYLIERDTEKLFNILYRIDVNPIKTEEAFQLGIPKQIADKLADFIIERELKKKITQDFFKNN